MALKITNIANEIENIAEFWQPITVTEFDQMQVKIAKLKGDYDWHNHKFEDKMFHVVAGQLFIELKDSTIEVNAGEMVVIPKDTDHKPFAPNEASVIFFESIKWAS